MGSGMIATRPSWAVAATAGQAEPEPKLLLATKSWLDAGSTRTDQTAGLVQPGEEKTAVYEPGPSPPRGLLVVGSSTGPVLGGAGVAAWGVTGRGEPNE